MRLIDADALVHDVMTEWGIDPHYMIIDNIDGIKAMTDSLILERINLQPTVHPWHRVEEPPKLDELVPNKFYASSMLVMFYHGGYYIGYALSDEKNGPVRWVEDCMTISPTHWMPTHWMPIEPPKEENDGN